MGDWLQVALSGFGVATPISVVGWYFNHRRSRNDSPSREVVVERSEAMKSIKETGRSVRVSDSGAGGDIVAGASGLGADPKA